MQGPGPTRSLARASGANLYVVPPQPPQPPLPLVPMADATVVPSGASQPHNNMQPYLAFNFCIAIQGLFPGS